jgi:hypothetical protein
MFAGWVFGGIQWMDPAAVTSDTHFNLGFREARSEIVQ